MLHSADELVMQSIEYTNRFPDLSILLKAVTENYELDSSFKNHLINYYVKEDEDLLQIVKLMIRKNFEFDRLDVFDLAKNGFFKTMEYFKSIGFDLNVRTINNENALFYVMQNNVARFNYIDGWWRTEDYINIIIDNCIRLGIDEKIINKQGRNLFHVLISAGMPLNYLSAVAHLDLDINQMDINGWTPLHHACAYSSDLVELYKLLLYLGADKTILTQVKLGSYGHDAGNDYNIDQAAIGSSAYDLALQNISSWCGYGENEPAGIKLRKELAKNLKP